ncbi:arf-GAP with GTPase, ANK repeat and PH domain-containing protein 3 isoform X2 [Nematostella vectensis]|uniref:arf-GAP with GTPase, ANK repeat and PH domain-containing protein 3 isoform X2 n=1 Tax=Nematostella vectensis TaxID=45351 RepID=UPI0020775EB0|nr:arf-GAP with GTPase, ANK repeat and PH domain-containing protein 3 isoform X2 [Nematostella vectensis]
MPVSDSLEAMAIRQEAERFQSFHPRLQKLYELLDQVDNVPLKRKMRELVNGLEESLLNSPEFTATKISSNLVLKLGVVGSSVSGKSFLVHRYLTGSCAKMESFTGRHKKEVIYEGQSHLLLVRDETGPPDLQFTQWVDAVIFVFSLDDELSYNVISGYYAKMAQYRNISDVPILLVAMKDGVNDEQPKMISDSRIRKLITDLKQCVYMEASALTGNNVDRIFQIAIEKLIQAKNGPVLTSYDPVQSPTIREGEANVYSTSPSNSIINSAVSTPQSTTKRSTRRRTMLFSKDKKEKEVVPDQDVGSGRAIPIKQGYLYKRSSNSIKQEWKKKYVTLLDDGSLVYYPNMHDYMDDVHAKVLNLKHTTVKIPGKRPPKASSQNSDSRPTTPVDPAMTESLEYEFTIISLEGKSWQYEAGGAEERDSWVQAIEQQILNSLQSNDSGREKSRMQSTYSNEGNDIQAIRAIPGNNICVDCGAPNPDWASLNLGALMCIECSGVHRNIGTHVSRVRSLDLDDWPSEVTAVMCSIGNSLANSIWEGRIGNREKPTPSSSREEKERWIRSKYENKDFLSELPSCDFSLGEQLYEAVDKEDLPLCILLLAYCTPDDVNAVNDDVNRYTALHVSSILGNIVITQLLIWYFADVKILDAKGRSALWHANSSGSKECSDILRHNGCNDLGTLIPQGSDVIL